MRPTLRWPALLAMLAACGAGPGAPDAGAPTFGAAPFQTVTSRSRALSLALFTSPQPPIRGEDAAELVVVDGSGAAVDGLDLTVVPWMPVMGHGSSVVPAVSAEGGGRYLVRRLELFMPGEWELRVSIAGAPHDEAVFDVTIQ